MIDAALTKLLGGPEPYVFVQPEVRKRWLSKRWVTKTHSHVEGTLLTLTPEGEAVARQTQALKTAFGVHEHPVTRQHCKLCGEASVFLLDGKCLQCRKDDAEPFSRRQP